MSDEDGNEAAVGENAAEKAGDARKTRGIRFSESEWDEVKNAQLLTDESARRRVRPRADPGACTRAGERGGRLRQRRPWRR